MTEMLNFKDVELYYDHVYALKGVSMNLQQGVTCAVGLAESMVRLSLFTSRRGGYSPPPQHKPFKSA